MVPTEVIRAHMIIAIDGPAGSGKSSVAKLVARRLGFHYLDTGAMYRAVAFRALSQGSSLADEDAIALVATTDEIAFGHEPGEALPSLISIAGVDVTAAIRAPEVDDAVSTVARYPRVRDAMVAQQRHLAQASDIVVEGRDIGTVVFPDAELKVYLTATPEERARRRAAQQAAAGIQADTAEVKDAIMRRDEADSKRAHSPLAAASDAVELDTTGLTLDQVVERIAALARERCA
jgi:CMP/dCMP kinase